MTSSIVRNPWDSIANSPVMNGIKEIKWSVTVDLLRLWNLSGVAISTAHLVYMNTRFGRAMEDEGRIGGIRIYRPYGIMDFIGGMIGGYFLGPFTALVAYAHYRGVEDRGPDPEQI
jgi:hypothetical protein